jgi:hypothetical protein
MLAQSSSPAEKPLGSHPDAILSKHFKTCFVGNKSSIAGPNCFHPQLGVQRLFSDALFPGPPDFSNEDE